MSMTFSGSSSDLFLSQTINSATWAMIVDQTDLFQFCVDLNPYQSGSDTNKIGRIKWDDPMTAPGETGALTAEDPTTSNVTVQIARQGLRRDISDLYNLAGPPTGAGIAEFASRMVEAASLRRTDMVTNLFTSVSSSAGTTETALTVDAMYDAQFALTSARVSAPWVAVLSPAQLVDFQSDLRTEAGPEQFIAATQDMLAGKGPGFAGNWHGIQVWSSNRVTDDGTDATGCMFGLGAFGYQEMPVSQIGALPGVIAQSVPSASPILVEFERSASTATSSIVASYYVGVVELEDERAVRVISSAS